MTDGTLIADLIRAQLDPDLVQRVTAALISAAQSGPVTVIRDEAAERRRAKDRERKALIRQANSADIPQTSADSADTKNAPSPSPSSLSPTPPIPPPTPTPVQSARTGEAGGFELSSDSKPRGKVNPNTLPTSEPAKRLATLFHRRLTTPWSTKEISAFKKLVIDLGDLEAIEAYYGAHWPPDRNKNILRHDLVTCLNNWPGEVDRARTWQRQQQPAKLPTKDFFADSSLAQT